LDKILTPGGRTGGRNQVIKLDIVNRVAERTGVPKMKAEQAVDALFHSMKEALARGERIELRGFGVFVVKPRKRGVGRNPRTGEEVAIPQGKTIRFKPGKELQAHGFSGEHEHDDEDHGAHEDSPPSTQPSTHDTDTSF
jgi:DNA-binding protein HU-beta